MVRMRREYKSQLEQSFNRRMYDKIEPGYMHLKYYDKLVPPHFHAGLDSALLEPNKSSFRHYVLHNSPKYEIASIEEHKMNEREPFCLVAYHDGNCQLLNQLEFQLFALQPLSNIQQDTLFLQAYLNPRKQQHGFLFSDYSPAQPTLEPALDQQAETEVMVLLGALNRYDEGYRDMETVEELDF
jgi:hypothetical protein